MYTICLDCLPNPRVGNTFRDPSTGRVVCTSRRRRCSRTDYNCDVCGMPDKQGSRHRAVGDRLPVASSDDATGALNFDLASYIID